MNSCFEQDLQMIKKRQIVTLPLLPGLRKGAKPTAGRMLSAFQMTDTKNICKRNGSGLAGVIFTAGRPFRLDNENPNLERKRLESPIMLAENLFAAAAVPIKMNDKVKGILLVGSRAERLYTKSDLSHMTKTAEKSVPGTLLECHKKMAESFL
ncbi:GAF domain-containing protein [Thalassobacillus sp. C254]|uniref:GAF domain-containing protein n=1 Tax=Thalassobacillus sp. C254 TaxID=1225341 RepID=UPI0006D0B5F7|nr:GAF domain-containing protein [Thalassobacillus sp. C254]